MSLYCSFGLPWFLLPAWSSPYIRRLGIRHVSNPSNLGFDDGGFYAGGLSSIKDLQIGDVVLPPDSQDRVESPHVEELQFLDVLAIQCPRLTTIEEGGKNHGIVDLQFRR